MFGNLYENIGRKIKWLAEWTFRVEAVCAIITGFILLLSGNGLGLYGLLTMVLGPIVAWVSSWLLYGFGELIEKTADNEANTRAIAELLKKDAPEKSPVAPMIAAVPEKKAEPARSGSKPQNAGQSAATIAVDHNNIICSACGCKQPNNRNVCWQCGATLTKSSH